MRDTTTDETKPSTRPSNASLSEAIMAHLPPGSRALTPCETTMDSVTHELRCAHKHMGKHLRTSPGASVTMLPSGLAHIVEPCGGRSEKHTDTDTTCDGGDPYVLWYVMAAPGSLTPMGPFGCIDPVPYGYGPYPAGMPNPNNPDPTGAQALVTRHWPAGVTVPYVINIPPSVLNPAVENIFTPSNVTGIDYTWNMFATDIAALMNNVTGVGGIPTASVPATQLGSYSGSAPNYDFAAYNPTPIILAAGQFIWGVGGCSGPTGNTVNEFIFLQNRNLGGVAGGLTSMLMNPQTGVITECDVIFAVRPILQTSLWAGVNTRTCTGLAHEVGHFWGLDHTNLHPGGTVTQPTPLAGVPSTLGAFYCLTALAAVPAMGSQYATSGGTNRVSSYAQAWRPDDIAAFSSLYPVNTIAGSKLPMINTAAVITGKVIDSSGAYDGGGVFGMNVYVVDDNPPVNPPANCTVNFPVVGTITGIARPDNYAVTGRLDTATGAPCSGDFRIDGIPAAYGTASDYTLYIEPLGSLNMTPMTFSEWWIDGLLNPVINSLNPTVIQVGYRGNGPLYGGALPVSSMSVTAGTIIQLDSSIDIQASVAFPFQTCAVSRPLVHVWPRATSPSPGGTITITVDHNKTACTSTTPMSGRPFQSITCTWNRVPVFVTLTSTSHALPFLVPLTTAIVTQGTVTVPAWATYPAVVEVIVLEVPGTPGSPPSVLGRNMVIY